MLMLVVLLQYSDVVLQPRIFRLYFAVFSAPLDTPLVILDRKTDQHNTN